MDSATRRLVRDRAAHRCEYCGLPQEALPLSTFHVEHVAAKQHGGLDDADNLALACHHWNTYKRPNIAGVDPETGAIVHLFHPRRDAWADHFEGRGGWIGGLTPVGRATVRTLAMNAPEATEARSDLA